MIIPERVEVFYCPQCKLFTPIVKRRAAPPSGNPEAIKSDCICCQHWSIIFPSSYEDSIVMYDGFTPDKGKVAGTFQFPHVTYRHQLPALMHSPQGEMSYNFMGMWANGCAVQVFTIDNSDQKVRLIDSSISTPRQLFKYALLSASQKEVEDILAIEGAIHHSYLPAADYVGDRAVRALLKPLSMLFRDKLRASWAAISAALTGNID
jgi:hypothetical protein